MNGLSDKDSLAFTIYCSELCKPSMCWCSRFCSSQSWKMCVSHSGVCNSSVAYNWLRVALCSFILVWFWSRDVVVMSSNVVVWFCRVMLSTDLVVGFEFTTRTPLRRLSAWPIRATRNCWSQSSLDCLYCSIPKTPSERRWRRRRGNRERPIPPPTEAPRWWCLELLLLWLMLLIELA